MSLTATLAQSFLPKDLKLIKIIKSKKGHDWIVKKVRQEFEVCPKCASPSNTRSGKCTSRVRDLGLQERTIHLVIHKHRYLCKQCKKTFTEPVSNVWPRRRTTQKFRKSLAQSAYNFSNLSKVKKTFGVSSGLIYQVYYEQIETKLREQKGKAWPSVLGIDEHFFSRSKGFREFATIFTNLGKKRVFDLVLGRDHRSLFEQLSHIPGRENVKVVCIDMSGTYKSFVQKFFPNAQIVSDKFHVLRLLNPAIISEGRKIHGHRQELKVKRKLLRSRIKLDVEERLDLDIYLQNKSVMRKLYSAKEELFEIYRTKGLKKVERKLDKFIARLKSHELPKLKTLGKTLSRWRQGVLNYFKYRYTNGFTEAMNNTAKLVQKRAYGYKNFRNYRLGVLSACCF